MDSNTRVIFGFLMGATASDDERADWTAPGNSTCDSNGSEGSWSCRGYGAVTCSIHPCVQIYNATISAGVLEEHLVASSSNTSWGKINDTYSGSGYPALIDTQCSAQSQTPSVQPPTTQNRWLPYDFTLADRGRKSSADVPLDMISSLPSNVTSLLDSGCLYLIVNISILDPVAAYLSGTLRGNELYTVGGGTEGANVSVFSVLGYESFEGSDLIGSIYNWGQTDLRRVQSIFANISQSLTTYIRTNSDRSQSSSRGRFSRDAQGEAYHYATCLKVQWPWISYPASLAVCTVVYFVTVAEATRRQGTPIWKASPLAWILRADGFRNQVSSSTRLRKGMKEKSGQIAVHLLDEDTDGPRICMADIKDPNLF
ncbi:hypothetical protein F5883DRAFT_531828 [Diaporthe sp. PMI_573]|nr:hypothetical protein F5883DRAFT_531828 [Diaporthaceae sp. PMI_573]